MFIARNSYEVAGLEYFVHDGLQKQLGGPPRSSNGRVNIDQLDTVRMDTRSMSVQLDWYCEDG